MKFLHSHAKINICAKDDEDEMTLCHMESF